MNILKKIFLLILTGMLAFGCYDPLEIDTKNLNKIEIPVKFSAPLMDGQFTLEFDSFFNEEAIGGDLITYENGRAFFKYDTVFNFYDELSEFLTMADVDFSDVTSFREKFNLKIDMADIKIDYVDTIQYNTDGGSIPIFVDTFVTINPQDTFKTKYFNNGVFVVPSDDLNYQLEVLNYGDPIELSLPFEVYRVDVASGLIRLYIDYSPVQSILGDLMTMAPSLDFHYDHVSPPFSFDSTISETMTIPIFKGLPELPQGVFIRTTIEIASLKSVATDLIFEEEYLISRLDTTIVLNLGDYYYYSDGQGQIELDVAAFLEVDNPKDTAIIPLPDTLYFGTEIEDLVFEHVVFNYGVDTGMTGSQMIDFDVFSSLPEHIDIEGFRLSNPELKLKVNSNFGFSSLFDIDTLMFTTDGAPELITEDGSASLNVPMPIDPASTSTFIPAGRDSIYLDAANSRLEDIELLNIDGLYVSYRVVINPDDEAGIEGKHNFFYDYSDDVEASMYDVSLNAEIYIPFEFKFEKISFPSSIESPIKENDLDSSFYFSDEDSIVLEVKMLTKDFPFNAHAQFYFDEVNAMGGMTHIDSMFSVAKELLPSSMDGTWDSTEVWSLTIDADKYENIKGADSLTIDITLSMDEDEYFILEEGKKVEIGYKFSISESSFVIIQE